MIRGLKSKVALCETNRFLGVMINRVRAVFAPVTDVEKCILFYRDKLGFNLNHKNDESAFLAIGGLLMGRRTLKLPPE
jgi:catechol-2,3-dioxygenase